MSWRVLFFGSDHISLRCLQALHSRARGQGLLNKLEVVCPLPKAAGRGQKELRTVPVRKYAEKHGLKLYDAPPKMFSPVNQWDLPEDVGTAFDIGVVVSFGYFLPAELIHAFGVGAINLHPSLLPSYRGAAPIQRALLSGDPTSGISVIDVAADGFDVGHVLYQEQVEVDRDVKYSSLAHELAGVGANALVYTLENYEKLNKEKISQSELASVNESSTAPKIKHKDTLVDWISQDSNQVYNRWRALDELTGVFTAWQGKRVRLVELARVDEGELDEETGEPGEMVVVSKKLYVKCKNGWIRCLRLQFDGRKPMDAVSFVNGHWKKASSEQRVFTTIH